MNKSQKGIKKVPPPQLPKQLREGSSIKEQIIVFKNNLEGQHQLYLNQTANIDLVLERIITKLTLLRHQGQTVKKDREPPLALVVDFCTKQLCAIMESHERLREGWKEALRGILEWPRTQICNYCERCIWNGEGVGSGEFQKVGLSEQNCAKLASIEYLQVEVEQLQLKYQQILQQNRRLKEKCLDIEILNTQNTNKLQQCNASILCLKQANAELATQLKESKEIAFKQGQLWSVKFQAIERENRRLAQLHTRAFANERQLNEIIQQNEREIEKIFEEVHRLNLEVVGFQLKFRQAMEGKAKGAEGARTKRQDQKILCEIPTQNTIDSAQSMVSKRQLEKMRRCQLQSVQERLSSYNVLA